MHSVALQRHICWVAEEAWCDTHLEIGAESQQAAVKETMDVGPQQHPFLNSMPLGSGEWPYMCGFKGFCWAGAGGGAYHPVLMDKSSTESILAKPGGGCRASTPPGQLQWMLTSRFRRALLRRKADTTCSDGNESPFQVHRLDRLLIRPAQADLSQLILIEASLQGLPRPSVVGPEGGNPYELFLWLAELGATLTTSEARLLRGPLFEVGASASWTATPEFFLVRYCLQLLDVADTQGLVAVPNDHQVAGLHPTVVAYGGVVAVALLGYILVAVVSLKLPLITSDEEGPSLEACDIRQDEPPIRSATVGALSLRSSADPSKSSSCDLRQERRAAPGTLPLPARGLDRLRPGLHRTPGGGGAVLRLTLACPPQDVKSAGGTPDRSSD